jgi:hypothetical protein
VFNALLYAVQVSLYSLMFMPSINQVTGIVTGIAIGTGTVDSIVTGTVDRIGIVTGTVDSDRDRDSG